MFLYFLLLLSLCSRTSSTEASESCNTLRKKVELLETKNNQLLIVTEKHTVELAAKEKRIRSLELILEQKSIISKEKKTNSSSPVHHAEKVNWNTNENNETSSKVFNRRYTIQDLNEKSHIKVYPKLSQPRKSLFLQKRENQVPVAFYSYMSKDELYPGRHHTIIFDTQKINIRNAYNKYTGIFNVPTAGIYYFIWTIYTECHGKILTEIVKNNEVWGSASADAEEVCDYHTSTSNAMIEASQGDNIFIRTTINAVSQGNIISNGDMKSTFSGFLLN